MRTQTMLLVCVSACVVSCVRAPLDPRTIDLGISETKTGN